MLARIAEGLPAGGGMLYEPKWDGFRAIVFRGNGDAVFIQSRDLKPLERYFPELHETLAAALPEGCVVDGEIVIATPHGLDFDALQMRLHPAASRGQARTRHRRPSSPSTSLRWTGGHSQHPSTGAEPGSALLATRNRRCT
jgi:ATP-dependent DNA ligase